MKPKPLVFLKAALPLAAVWAATPLVAEAPGEPKPTNQIVVSPQGPRDGGDFGPHTPGTKTSGLQEALDAAKRQAKDVYLAGGSWTADKTEPVVYHLHETLRVPWMQNLVDERKAAERALVPLVPSAVFSVLVDCVVMTSLDNHRGALSD